MIKQNNFLKAILALCLMYAFRPECATPSTPPKEEGFDKEAFIASSAEEKVLRLGLVDCIAYALKNNSEIKIKRIEPQLREADILIARSDFAPTVTVDYNMRDNTKASSTTLAGARLSKSRDIDASAAISGKLPTGSEYNFNFTTERYKSNSAFQSLNPYYATEPKITITQPFFEGAGILVNRANIVIAKNNKNVSVENFKDTVMEILTNTKVAYYNYVYYLENYALTHRSLMRAKDLFQINQARYQKGLLSSVELLEAETALLERRKGLLVAESDLKKAEDDLKLITNLADDPYVWNARIEIIDKPALGFEKIDLVESLKNAFSLRPDYQAERLNLRNNDVQIMLAKNALFPTLDLVGSFGLNGLGKKFSEAQDKTKSDYKDWSLGFKFTLPLGKLDVAQYDQERLKKAQALLAFKRLEQDIILEVRDKVRTVETQRRKLEASELVVVKERQNYRAQRDRYATGYLSTHDMFEYQDEFSQAELDYLKALVDYHIAIINLEKAEGLTLVKNNIKLEE